MPGENARQLYLAILAEGGRIPISSVDAAEQTLIDQLVRTGLVLPNLMDGVYTAISPRAMVGRVSSELRSEATRLLLRAERLPSDMDGLTRAYDAVPSRADQLGEAVHVEGYEHIRHRITQLASDCRGEMLTAQPGPRAADVLELALKQELPVLARGCAMRTLYQPIALLEPAAVEYAAVVSERGARLRTLDESFQRMLIFDRSVAVVPAAGDHSKAAFITDPAAVAFLVSVYERDWARADAVQWDVPATQHAARTAADRVGRLLATGLTQRAVATRLGLSERTVAGHIARLRTWYGAQTLFQLGWLMRGGDRTE